MSEKTQAEILARWLDSPPGTPAPEGIERDVLETIYALQPERAPSPSLDLDAVWESAATTKPEVVSETPAEVIPLASRRWKRWLGGGAATTIAMAATMLFIMRQVPMEPMAGTEPLRTAPSSMAPVASPPKFEVESEASDEVTAEITEATQSTVSKSGEQADMRPTKAPRATTTNAPQRLRAAAPPPASAPEAPSPEKTAREAKVEREPDSVPLSAPLAPQAPPPPMDAPSSPESIRAYTFSEKALEEDGVALDIGGLGAGSGPSSRARSQTQKIKKAYESASPSEKSVDEFNLMRERARSQASLLLVHAQMDEGVQELLGEVDAYINAPIGPSPQNKLLAMCASEDTHTALKPQLWYLVGEIYRIRGEQESALEAYKKALGS